MRTISGLAATSPKILNISFFTLEKLLYPTHLGRYIARREWVVESFGASLCRSWMIVYLSISNAMALNKVPEGKWICVRYLASLPEKNLEKTSVVGGFGLRTSHGSSFYCTNVSSYRRWKGETEENHLRLISFARQFMVIDKKALPV